MGREGKGIGGVDVNDQLTNKQTNKQTIQQIVKKETANCELRGKEGKVYGFFLYSIQVQSGN